ncbi:unnamed protein product [Closterium sp. NIES-65]|nr:unnamed protein product [Closterium sp. NIES-65]
MREAGTPVTGDAHLAHHGRQALGSPSTPCHAPCRTLPHVPATPFCPPSRALSREPAAPCMPATHSATTPTTHSAITPAAVPATRLPCALAQYLYLSSPPPVALPSHLAAMPLLTSVMGFEFVMRLNVEGRASDLHAWLLNAKLHLQRQFQDDAYLYANVSDQLHTLPRPTALAAGTTSKE